MKRDMTTKTSPPIKIKKENANDEIKDFAETAMNELLGWYGYDSVDRIDLSVKPSKLMASTLCTSNENQNDINGHRNNQREDSLTPEHDSSRDDSKSPNSIKNSERLETHCGWCHRLVSQNSPEFLTTPDGPRYCSESCFAQSRRASFKRAKSCDWCRHVRHAVSYVDFQDGASQLQFCSDKCLNQYKMQIFCKETQAHLDMNPHLKEKCNESSGGLITPDLWLKNCQSRSVSPASEPSRSPTPTQININNTNNNNNNNNNINNNNNNNNKNNNNDNADNNININSSTNKNCSMSQQPQPCIHKPLISVAPASKLMSRATPGLYSSRQSPKHSKKRRVTRLSISHNNVNNNGVINLNTHNSQKVKMLANNLSNVANSVPKAPLPPSKPCTFTNVQDLRLHGPPLTNVDPSHPQARPNLPPPPPPFFTSTNNNYLFRPPFIRGHHPHRLMDAPPLQQLLSSLPPDITGLSSILGAAPPPVTVIVPYPIIVPLPIPIPIPLPIIDFLKATNCKSNLGTDNANSLNNNNNNDDDKNNNNPSNNVDTEPRDRTSNISIDEQIFEDEEMDEPLDFTKSKVRTDLINEEQGLFRIDEGRTKNAVIEEVEIESGESSEKQRVPRFKITRLQTKRLITKESENSRPLRKRKRVIDCDYLKTSKEEEAKNKK